MISKGLQSTVAAWFRTSAPPHHQHLPPTLVPDAVVEQLGQYLCLVASSSRGRTVLSSYATRTTWVWQLLSTAVSRLLLLLTVLPLTVLALSLRGTVARSRSTSVRGLLLSVRLMGPVSCTCTCSCCPSGSVGSRVLARVGGLVSGRGLVCVCVHYGGRRRHARRVSTCWPRMFPFFETRVSTRIHASIRSPLTP